MHEWALCLCFIPHNSKLNLMFFDFNIFYLIHSVDTIHFFVIKYCISWQNSSNLGYESYPLAFSFFRILLSELIFSKIPLSKNLLIHLIPGLLTIISQSSPLIAANIAAILRSVSINSYPGSESATIPAPACTEAFLPCKTTVRITIAKSASPFQL